MTKPLSMDTQNSLKVLLQKKNPVLRDYENTPKSFKDHD